MCTQMSLFSVFKSAHNFVLFYLLESNINFFESLTPKISQVSQLPNPQNKMAVFLLNFIAFSDFKNEILASKTHTQILSFFKGPTVSKATNSEVEVVEEELCHCRYFLIYVPSTLSLSLSHTHTHSHILLLFHTVCLIAIQGLLLKLIFSKEKQIANCF